MRLLIIGQGDPVFSSWGHTGIAIKNNANGKDIFYDFGNFYFEDEDFYKNFAMGRLLYKAWVTHTEPYIRSVLFNKRDITEYVLSLSPESKLNMYNALRINNLPENRTYLYHHYNDNCSTRIRDYIDNAVDGQMKRQTGYSRGATFRESFLRLTSHKKTVGSALSMLQGTPIDGEITVWQEMFLPVIMEEVIRDFTYEDNNGRTVSLVKDIIVHNKAEHRKAIPPDYSSPYGSAILIAALLFSLALYLNMRTLKGKRKLFSLFSIFSGLILGLTGCILFFLAVFTDHSYSYYNLNLFMINPLALFIIPAAIMYWRKGEGSRKRLDLLWLIQLCSTAIMIAIKMFPAIGQDNHLEIIIILPLMTALSPLIPSFLKKIDLLR